jgi:hypothetical protein
MTQPNNISGSILQWLRRDDGVATACFALMQWLSPNVTA